jgi:hypothetical protein
MATNNLMILLQINIGTFLATILLHWWGTGFKDSRKNPYCLNSSRHNKRRIAMKKVFCLFGSILICCLAIGTASASVTGSGTFELFGLPDSAVVADYRYGTSYTDPDTGENVSIQTYFAA